MNRLSLLILLAGCDSSVVAGSPDAAGAPSFDPGTVSVTAEPPAAPPDFACLSHQPPTTAPDPLAIAGTVESMTTNGSLVPVDAVELQVFRAGQPVVLAHGTSSASGAFAFPSVASGGHPLQAYVKATKQGYRTTFLYPPFPLATNTTAPLPTISDAMFASLVSSLGATQDDHKNGVLLVAVADCEAHPVAGATLSVIHGNSPAGHVFDLGAGQYIVFDVPDGKTRVSASYNGIQLPEHDVMVRAQDPDCSSPRSTLTATSVIPAP
jgi:hypothetical protein